MAKYYLAAKRERHRTIYYNWNISSWVNVPRPQCFCDDFKTASRFATSHEGTHVETVEVTDPVLAPPDREDSPFYCEPCGMAHDPLDPTCRKHRK